MKMGSDSTVMVPPALPGGMEAAVLDVPRPIPRAMAGRDRDQVIATLRANEKELRHRGVLHAALFGSVARGDAKPSSDIDIMIEIEPDAPVGVFEYVGIKQYIAGLFEGPVDVVDRDGLKPYVRPAATSDAIYAF